MQASIRNIYDTRILSLPHYFSKPINLSIYKISRSISNRRKLPSISTYYDFYSVLFYIMLHTSRNHPTLIYHHEFDPIQWFRYHLYLHFWSIIGSIHYSISILYLYQVLRSIDRRMNRSCIRKSLSSHYNSGLACISHRKYFIISKKALAD